MVEWNAQTIHALRILRSYGMQTESIHTIRAVVITKGALMFYSPVDFTDASDLSTLMQV